MTNNMQKLATCGAMSALIATAMLGFTSEAEAQALILNEYNAVGPEKTLEDDPDPAFPPPNDVGNGGDWIELVVTQNIASIQGWRLEWDNLDPDSGNLTFSNNALWTNLKAGTIITIRVGATSNTSFSTACASQDWTINIGAGDTTYIAQGGAHAFKTDNDGWRMQIKNSSGTVVQSWVGEGTSSTVNSKEVYKLEANPSTTSNTAYNDGNCSSFSAPNCWNDGASVQSFASLRVCT